MSNLGTLIPRHAKYRPDHTAIIFEDTRLTYAGLHARTNRLAHVLLSLGLKKGDAIATILPNTLEVLEILWTIAKTGMVVVPLSPLLRGEGLARLINDSDSLMIITVREMVEHIAPIRQQLHNIREDRCLLVDADDVPGWQSYHALAAAASEQNPPYIPINRDDLFNIMYSSGTTGLPKGIIHTHYVRANYCTGFGSSYRMTPESIVLHSGSLVFNGAFLSLMPAFYHGCTYILLPHFDVERMITMVEQEKVTHMVMVPSQIVAMLHSPAFRPERMQSLEMILTVGAPLHLEHKEELNHKLPGIFYELYGLTEGFVTILDKTMYEQKPGSVGVPPPLFEMRIVDDYGKDLPAGEVGEIVGRGPILMPGYYKRPDLTALAIRDGWLYTGDMGYMDQDGFLFLVDRKKDLIISGGVNVYPRDIEELIVQHPHVIEAAVFGAPDEQWGEAPVAAVILDDPAAITAEALRDWINERVEARYQKVREVVVKDSFPRSAAGKTLKREMREVFWSGRSTRI